MKSTIKGLFNGTAINLAVPEEHTFSAEEVADLLSHVKRFNGYGISVAEHSIRVAHTMYKLTGNPKLGLLGLLHDSAEGYIGDLATPLKVLLGESIILIEERVYRAIVEQICPTLTDYTEFNAFLKVVDLIHLRSEYDQLINVGAYQHNKAWDVLLTTHPNIKELWVTAPIITADKISSEWLSDFYQLNKLLDTTLDLELVTIDTKWGTISAEVNPEYKHFFQQLGDFK